MAPPDDWKEAQWARAREAWRAQNRAGIFAPLEAVLDRAWDDVPTLELAAEIAGEIRDHKRHVRYAAALLGLDPHADRRRLALAGALLAAGAPAIAADTIAPFLARHPQHPEALVLQLRAVAAREDGTQLAALLDTLARLPKRTRNAGFVHAVAQALVDAGRDRRALVWLDRFRDVTPDAVATRLRAEIHFRLGEDAAADALFATLATDSDPARRLGVLLFRARIAHRQGAREQAAAQFLAAHLLAPAEREPLDYLVRHHTARQEFAAAEAFLATLEAAQPGIPQLVWLKSAIARARGDIEGAIGMFEAAIAAHPLQLDHHSRLADLLAELGRVAEMGEVLERALLIAPKAPGLHQRRLRQAQLRGASAQEIHDLAAAMLAADPRHQTALLHHANALLRLGRREEALERYLAAARLHPRNVTFWRSAASVALSRNRRDVARAVAREADDIFAADSSEDLTSRAEIAQAAGLTEESLDLAERAVARDPAALAARQIAARLWVAAGEYARAWPHLDALQAPADRPAAATRLYAQALAGFQYLRPAALAPAPVEGRFPDLLFAEITRRSPVMPRAACNDLVLHVTSTLASGGAERQVALTVAEMARHGRKVELVAEDLDPANARDFFLPLVAAAGVQRHILRDLRAAASWRELLAREPDMAEAVMALSAMPAEIALFALPLLGVLRERRPAVVHLWQDMVSVAGGVAAVLAGVPRIIFATRSTRPVEYQRTRPYFAAAYRAFLSRPGIAMLANSANGARDYEAWLDLPAETVDVVHNGYDFAAMRARAGAEAAAACRAEAGVPAEAIVLGGVMRCSFEKRPELWTEAACELARRDRRVHAILVGEGPMRQELMDLVASRGLAGRIHFVGRRSPIEPWMRAMDVLFLSSLTEGLPNVLIEAQSLGVAVCTMRVGGAPETVRDGHSAVVIDEGSTNEIADRIGGLLLDPQRLQAFGAAGVTWTDASFSTHAMLDRLRRIYEVDASENGDRTKPRRRRGKASISA